jgi:hypothetical protein
MIVGAFVALFFLGLPLAIIGLFIASTLDRRNSRPPDGFTASQEPAASTSAMNYAGDKRRIVHGRNSVITTAPVERYELTRPMFAGYNKAANPRRRNSTLDLKLLCEAANNLPQVSLTHSSRSLNWRMPLRPPLALFRPSLELTRHAQWEHTNLTPHNSARFKYLVIPIGTNRLFADLSDNTRFFKGLQRGGAVRRHSALRPAFWDYPSSCAARRHQQNLHPGCDFPIRKSAILNWPSCTPFAVALFRSFHDLQAAWMESLKLNCSRMQICGTNSIITAPFIC